jgi:hypothetical protein
MAKSPSWPTGSTAMDVIRVGAWLPGVAYLVAALTPALVFGAQACVAGLVVAILANFILYLPLSALALNDWQPIGPDDPAPDLTGRVRVVLLILWTATAWLGAAASATS